MKTNVLPSALIALVLAGTTATIGCSSFTSGSSDYVGPGGLSKDVSALPDPNADIPARKPRNGATVLHDFENIPVNVHRDPETLERILTQADRFFEQKRYSDASLQYKKFLKTPAAATAQPELLATIHYRLGTIERKRMLFSNALKEFKQATELVPQNNDYLFSYAKTCYESRDFQTADRSFVTLLNRDASYPEAQRYYGLTLLESSNRTNALTPLTASVGELQAYALLTDKYYEKGELEQARQAEGQTIQIAARLGKQTPEFPSKTGQLGQLNAYAANAYQPTNAEPYTSGSVPATPTPGLESNVSQSDLAATIPTPQSIPVPSTESQPQNYMGYAPAIAQKSSNNVIAGVPTTENTSASYQNVIPTTEAVVAQAVPAQATASTPEIVSATEKPQELPKPGANMSVAIAPTTSSAVVETSQPIAAAPTVPANSASATNQGASSYSLSASSSLLRNLETVNKADETQSAVDNSAFANSGNATPTPTQDAPVFTPIPYVPTQAPALASVPTPNVPPQGGVPTTQAQDFQANTLAVQSAVPIAEPSLLPVQQSVQPIQNNYASEVYAQATAPAEIPVTSPIPAPQPVDAVPTLASDTDEFDDEDFAFATSGSQVTTPIPVPASLPNEVMDAHNASTFAAYPSSVPVQNAASIVTPAEPPVSAYAANFSTQNSAPNIAATSQAIPAYAANSPGQVAAQSVAPTASMITGYAPAAPTATPTTSAVAAYVPSVPAQTAEANIVSTPPAITAYAPSVAAPTANSYAAPATPATASYAPNGFAQTTVPNAVHSMPAYVAAVPANNVPMNAPVVAPEVVPTQTQPAVTGVQGVLPSDSLFNID